MTAVRTIDGIALVAAGDWEVDPGLAEVAFIGRRFGLTNIRGRFTDVAGAVTIGEDIARSTVLVEIAMDSMDFGNETSDDHLRSHDLFDVGSHPTATFASTPMIVDCCSRRLIGDLTIEGTTRSISLDVEYPGFATDPWSSERAVFSASTTVDREDSGLNWNMILHAGGSLVSKQIRLEINAELIRQNS